MNIDLETLKKIHKVYDLMTVKNNDKAYELLEQILQEKQFILPVVMQCKFLVDLLPRKDFTCDVFIYGEDDFKAKEFDTEIEAINWIKKQKFGKYTITKIYFA